MDDHALLDEALESIAEAGPDLRNGMTNHAPMAAEALCAMRRGDAVRPWLETYRPLLMPWPSARASIPPDGWRDALGRPDRARDWRAFFRNELEEAPWSDVLERWAGRLAPAVSAAAAHGVIRVGHAVRALARAETPSRRRELADALASWASTYQVLPTALAAPPAVPRPPHEAIALVRPVPEAERHFDGTITGALAALDARFAPVIALADLDGDPAAVISDLTRTFARVYLANAHDVLRSIVFVHGVTSAAALRPLLPHLAPTTARTLLRYAWQTSCALYAAFGQRPFVDPEPEPPPAATEALIDRAIATGDEHAIKLAAACLAEHALAPHPAYLAAAWHAATLLPG